MYRLSAVVMLGQVPQFVSSQATRCYPDTIQALLPGSLQGKCQARHYHQVLSRYHSGTFQVLSRYYYLAPWSVNARPGTTTGTFQVPFRYFSGTIQVLLPGSLQGECQARHYHQVHSSHCQGTLPLLLLARLPGSHIACISHVL